MININKFLILSNNEELYSVVSGGLTSNLIPNMTSNTAPIGVVSAISVNQSNYAWRAFDGLNTGNGWLVNGANDKWIAYEFNMPTRVTKYSITPSYNTASSPKNFRLEGSNDNSNWAVLDTRIDINDWILGDKKEFIIDDSKINLYKSYRLFIESNNGHNTYTSVGELEMFEYITPLINEIPLQTEQNFINHGMDKSTEIDLNSQITNKVFIVQNSTTLGSGKVFNKTIDTTKTPIKKVLFK